MFRVTITSSTYYSYKPVSRSSVFDPKLSSLSRSSKLSSYTDKSTQTCQELPVSPKQRPIKKVRFHANPVSEVIRFVSTTPGRLGASPASTVTSVTENACRYNVCVDRILFICRVFRLIDRRVRYTKRGCRIRETVQETEPSAARRVE